MLSSKVIIGIILSMERQIEVFFSNRIELLYENLKSLLFAKGQNPFAKRALIVPSPPIKSYLMRKMAEDREIKVAFGLEILYLDQSFTFLQNEPHKPIPTFFELSLLLEQELAEITAEPQSALFAPLFRYLDGDSSKQRLKLEMLSQELAKLFLKYGEYGGEFLNALESKTSPSWQGALWTRIFSKSLTYPYALYSKDYFPKTSYAEIHLFGISFLSHLKHSFFTKVAKTTPLCYWLLSPCQAFWCDIRSDRESSKIVRFLKKKGICQSSLNDLQMLLKDCNPLLANFGKLGRQMAEELSKSSLIDAACYQIAEAVTKESKLAEHFTEEISLDSSQSDLTLLYAIQADLASLRNPQEKIKLNSLDNSIQIHSAASKLREVEAIYQVLLHTIKSSAESIEPKDIIVMAPNISVYAPYIKMVFGRGESLLDYQIMDLNLVSQKSLAQAFLKLLDLSKSRWEPSELLKIFSYPFFQKKHDIYEEELYLLKKWAEELGITFGFNLEHRNELLKREGFSNQLIDKSGFGTWEYALDALLFGLAYAPPEKDEERCLLTGPLTEPIDLSQSEFLGKIFYLLKNLKSDLEPLAINAQKSLTEWMSCFSDLIEKYFIPEYYGEEFDKDYESLKKIFEQFRKADHLLSGKKIFAASVLKHIRIALEAPETSYREKHLQAVRFSSLLPMRAVPAKIVLLLGLEEGAFPRTEPKSSLNEMVLSQKGDYCPTQSDYDRYLFLEAILSARKHLIFSYTAKNSVDGKKAPPSLLVREFLEYADSAYLIGEKKPSEALMQHHPYFSFDRSYFAGNASFPSYSKRDYLAALSYYAKKKQLPHAFVKSFQIFEKQEEQKSQALTIDIRSLSAFARNPIQTYFNKTLQIFLKTEEKNNSEFELSALSKYLLRKKALKIPLDRVLALAEREGDLPKAPFKEVAKAKIAEEIIPIEGVFKKHGILREEIFEIELTEACNKAFRNEQGWKIPPCFLKAGLYEVKIVGKIPFVAAQGLILLGNKKLPNLIKSFPERLLFQSICGEISEKKILFLEDGSFELLDGDHNLQLANFIAYYISALKNLSPLMPEWVEAIIANSEEALEKSIRKSLNSEFFIDPYLSYAMNDDLLPSAREILEAWQPECVRQFGMLYEKDLAR